MLATIGGMLLYSVFCFPGVMGGLSVGRFPVRGAAGISSLPCLQAGHKMLHTCTSRYGYAAMFESSIEDSFMIHPLVLTHQCFSAFGLFCQHTCV